MVRTIVVLTVLLAGLLLLLMVVTDDSPKRRIALHNPMVMVDDGQTGAGFATR